MGDINDVHKGKWLDVEVKVLLIIGDVEPVLCNKWSLIRLALSLIHKSYNVVVTCLKPKESHTVAKNDFMNLDWLFMIR